MTRLYFVRHGKTEWNLEGRYQGAHGDSPLLAQSYLEIGLLAEYLNNVRFAKAYCSPIKRARVTAQKLVSLLEHPVKLESDRAFQEFDSVTSHRPLGGYFRIICVLSPCTNCDSRQRRLNELLSSSSRF